MCPLFVLQVSYTAFCKRDSVPALSPQLARLEAACGADAAAGGGRGVGETAASARGGGRKATAAAAASPASARTHPPGVRWPLQMLLHADSAPA